MKFILLLTSLLFLSTLCDAQYVYTIKADSVLITSSCDSAELIIKNHTQGIQGFLYNTGNGRTIFKEALVRLNDSTYLIGADTLKMTGGMTTLQKLQLDSLYDGLKVDTFRVLNTGAGISTAFVTGFDSLALKNAAGGFGVSISSPSDSSLLYSIDSTKFASFARVNKVADSLSILISEAGSGSVTHVGSGYGLTGGPITSTGTLQADTTTIATLGQTRRIADSAAIANRTNGFNLEFVYGAGVSGIPIKNSDSVYTNSGLIGNNVQVFLNGSSTSMMLYDSATWNLTGRNPNTPYFKYIKSAGQLTFCNFGSVSSLVNGQFVVSVFGGPQGYPALIDAGSGTLLPPNVDAGGSQTIVQPASSATLVGSASSSNVGGSITSSTWSFVSGPSTPTIASPASLATAVSGMSGAGNYTFELTATDNGGRQGSAETQITVSNGETISASPSSLGGFDISSGYQSASQSFNLSGTRLGTNTVTVTAPTEFLVSLDNVTFSQSVTVSPTGGTIFSTPVYVAIAATATAGTASGNVILTASGATTQLVAVSGTVEAYANNISKYNFSYVAKSVPGWTNIFGNPGASGGISATNAVTGWTLSTAGLTGNWQSYSGYYGDTSNGPSTATLPPDSAFSTQFPSNVMYSGDIYNASVNYTGSNYGMAFTNLPAGNYTIQIIGRVLTSQFNNGGYSAYHVQFGTGADQAGYISVNNNISQFVTFTGTITTGQTINLGAFSDNISGGQLGWITGLIITRN